MSLHIAVDIGGTQMRAALYSSEHITPIKLNRIATQGDGQPPVARLKGLIASLLPVDQAVSAIAVAAPGPIDPHLGVVLAAPNIPGWFDLPLKSELEDQFHIPVALGNDANLAALGEWQFGAGQGHHYLMYLTISTGIGAGVIINDQLLVGWRGLAAELGHVVIMQDGPLCGCGHRGHLEAVASGTAIAKWVQAELANGVCSSLPLDQKITGKMISEAAYQGDQLAITALNRSGTFIGQGIANFLHIFNPSIIIVGGGVTLSGKYFLEPMIEAMKANVITPHYLDGLQVTTAALGDEAGLMGALALARSIQP